MGIKRCELCKKEFNPNSNSQKFCSKDCFNGHRKEYFFLHKEKRIKNFQKWIKENPKEWKKIRCKTEKKYREKYPEKVKAHNEASRKIKIPKGQLCEICKINLATEKHHSNYDKPLRVKFLCIKCHNKLHNSKK